MGPPLHGSLGASLRLKEAIDSFHTLDSVAGRGNGYAQPVRVVNVQCLLARPVYPAFQELPGPPLSRMGAANRLACTKAWVDPTGHFKGGDMVSPNCSLFQQVTLSPSLFNPEEFMPLDPTQEPIFPPELLVGDAPGRGLTQFLCHEPLEACSISYQLGPMWPCPFSDTQRSSPSVTYSKGTHTSFTHVTLSTESGSPWHFTPWGVF